MELEERTAPTHEHEHEHEHPAAPVLLDGDPRNEGAFLEEQPQQVPVEFELTLQPHELHITSAGLAVGTNPETGDRHLVIGPLILTIDVPMSAEGARAVGSELAGVSGLTLATPADLAKLA